MKTIKTHCNESGKLKKNAQSHSGTFGKENFEKKKQKNNLNTSEKMQSSKLNDM